MTQRLKTWMSRLNIKGVGDGNPKPPPPTTPPPS